MNNEPDACDVLVHSGRLLTVDREDRIVADGAIAVTGNRIVAVGPTPEVRARYRAHETIDAAGGIVHPGFIDAHIHISQYTSRCVLPLMAGTSVTMGDWKAALTPEDEHASAQLAAVDYLRSGYTAFVDPGTIFEPDAVASVAGETGLRIWLTDPYVGDMAHVLGSHEPDLVSATFLGRWPKNTDEALRRTGGQLYRNDISDGLVRGFIGLYGAATASPELTRHALAVARQAGVQFQEHRGYNPQVVREEERAAGASAVQRLFDAGLLGPGTSFTHMNAVSADDVRLLAETRTAIIWCPFAQLRAMGTGFAEPRMVELSRKGAPVGLATDIPRTVAFDALGSLAVANAAACGSFPNSHEILRMRTVSAAATIGAASDLGSIEVGKKADLVVRGPSALEFLGTDVAAEAAVLGVSEPPALTLINGKIVFRTGRPLRLEPEVVAAKGRASVKGLLARTGLAG